MGTFASGQRYALTGWPGFLALPNAHSLPREKVQRAVIECRTATPARGASQSAFARVASTYPPHLSEGISMGPIELLIIVLVILAIAGGIGVSPLLWILLIIALVLLLTRGGFGYRRGGRL
jgi:hypothetical protein